MSKLAAVLHYFQQYDQTREFHSSSDGPRLLWTDTPTTYPNERALLIRAMGKRLSSHLTIDCGAEEVKEAYRRYECVPLRPYRGERTLVVGCGNHPVANGSWDLVRLGSEYREEHHHLGAYTVNPDLGMNPSVVMAFGKDPRAHLYLPPGAFDLVHLEGFRWESDTDSPYWREALLHVLRDNGEVRGTEGRLLMTKRGDSLRLPSDNTALLSIGQIQ